MNEYVVGIQRDRLVDEKQSSSYYLIEGSEQIRHLYSWLRKSYLHSHSWYVKGLAYLDSHNYN